MQKRLADYFRTLIEPRPGEEGFLADYYDSTALLRSEEASLVVGLLVSLNVVDCNLCIKVRKKKFFTVLEFALYEYYGFLVRRRSTWTLSRA